MDAISPEAFTVLVVLFGIALMLLSSCSLSVSTDVPAEQSGDSAASPLTVSPAIITGNFADCAEYNDGYLIGLPAGTTFGCIQIHNRSNLPWYECYEYDAKIVNEWDYVNGMLKVSDPYRFLVNGSYSYRVMAF